MLLKIIISAVFLVSVLLVYLYIKNRRRMLMAYHSPEIIYVMDLSNHIVEVRSVRIDDKLPEKDGRDMRWRVTVLSDGSTKKIYYDKSLSNPFFEDQLDLVEEFKKNAASFQNTDIQGRVRSKNLPPVKAEEEEK